MEIKLLFLTIHSLQGLQFPKIILFDIFAQICNIQCEYVEYHINLFE